MTRYTGMLSSQRGAVLAIVLILLLVVTLIGVTTMSSSGVQTFLARNNFFKETSFQNAESSVRVGEANWSASLSTCLAAGDCSTDVYPAMIDDMSSFDWSGAADAKNSDNTITYGKYTVEFLGKRPVAGESDKEMWIYRVTARGLGPNDKAMTRVQTIYRKCVKTDGAPCPT